MIRAVPGGGGGGELLLFAPSSPNPFLECCGRRGSRGGELLAQTNFILLPVRDGIILNLTHSSKLSFCSFLL